jgi:phosphate:Na+ symporter
MAIMYFVFNLCIVLVSLPTLPWMPAWLEKMCPPTPEQDLSRPMYLQTEALQSPETALDLVALEQLRLVRALHGYLDIARGQRTAALKLLHEAADVLSGEISQFLEALVAEPISANLTARVISFQRKQETIRVLEDNVFLFAQTLESYNEADKLAGRLVEAMDTILLTASDALTGQDAFDIDMLIQMTDDRGTLMERLRRQIKVDEAENVGGVAAVHYATTLFERNVWLLRQLGLWIREDKTVTAA